jgi:hypothetical protein
MHGTDGFDLEWLDLDLHSPEPTFTLEAKHAGRDIRVIAVAVDGSGLPTGTILTTPNLGRVIHATDPVPTWGQNVTNATQLQARMALNDAVIVLAPGSTWNGADFNVACTGSRITTPLDNPARVTAGFIKPANWVNVHLDGLVMSYDGADLTANGRDWAIELGPTSSGCRFTSIQIYASNITPAIYQALPPGGDLLLSPYRTTGMPFVVDGITTTNSNGAIIDGYSARNVYRGLAAKGDLQGGHIRIHGFYFDCFLLDGGAGGRIHTLSASHPYGLYDERDSTTSFSGSGNSPHTDLWQLQGSSPQNFEILYLCYVIGETRARGIGPSAGAVLTNLISNVNPKNCHIRCAVFDGQGSITAYLDGDDWQLDYVTKISYGPSGSASASRFNDLSNEGYIGRSILDGPVTSGTILANGYITVRDSITDIRGSEDTYVYGNNTIIPPTLTALGQLSRPRAPQAGRGALTTTGHFRNLAARPTAPSATLTGVSGGFTATLATVTGASLYRIRYRRDDIGVTWTVQESATPSFTSGAVGSAVPVAVQTWVQTADGISGWSSTQTVSTLASFVGDFPASNNFTNITRTAYVQPTLAADWQPFTNVSVPSNCLALLFLSRSSSSTITLDTGVDANWALLGSHTQSTTQQQQVWWYRNDTGSAVNKSFRFTSGGSRSAAAILVIIPRTTAGAILVPRISAGAGASNTVNGNHPNLTLPLIAKAWWGASVAYNRDASAVNLSTPPTDFTQSLDQPPFAVSNAYGGIALSERFFETLNLDPTASVLSATSSVVSFTVGVVEELP